MSSALTVHSHLPPTTNFLDSQQRLRLMRSTRKLGAVLGTTPYLLENDTSFALLPLGKNTSKALKRQGSIFTHHYSSSLSVTSVSTSTTTSSHHPSPSASSIVFPEISLPSSESLPLNPPGLTSTRRARTGDKAPQLYLRVDAIPVSPTDDRVTSSPPSTPCTPSFPTPITPIMPNITEIRRKRMAKLARHLGENIPTELVLTPESAQDRCTRRRTQSARATPASIGCEFNSKPPGRSKQEWVGEWNRSNIRDVQKELRNLRLK